MTRGDDFSPSRALKLELLGVLPLSIEAYTIHITDPRQSKNQQYSLQSLMLIVFSSVISGYDTPDSMVEFAKLKLDWLRQYTELKSVPCAETLRFFIAGLQPAEFIKAFEAFVHAMGATPEGDIISIDGKTMRGTRNKTFEALHVVSAWSRARGITLAALESKGKANEIETVPELLDLLDIKGATVTTDAMSCQRAIAAKIREREGHYVLQIKNNQANLLKEIQAYHHKLERDGYGEIVRACFEEVDKGHGRLETRTYQQFELSDWVAGRDAWVDARSVIRVERTRVLASKETREVAWYLSSLAIDAKHAAEAVRGHWECENKLHWRLDVIFKEDDYRQNTGAITMALLKRFCMNLLTTKDKSKRRMKHKVMAAAIDDGYRAQMLFGA